ncbi:MAG: hypothetical protein ACK4RZ_14200 [Paracoccaceae bacterium]
MLKLKLENELADIRAQLDRLKRREAMLQDALREVAAVPPQAQRPGWPIRRIVDTDRAACH